MKIQKQEFRKFVNLFDAWSDTVFLCIEWKKVLDESEKNKGYIKKDWMPLQKKKLIKDSLSLIKEYDLTDLLDEIESNLLDLRKEDREYFIKTILSESTLLYAYFSPRFRDTNEFNPSEDIHYLISGKNIVNAIWSLFEHSQKIPEDFLS